ncbi:hypothetical protein ACP70R_003283 [Stipagrostis hirtigluma subsp. patula]
MCLPWLPTSDDSSSASSSSGAPGQKTVADAAASPPKPRRATRTVSRCSPNTARGTHAFEITGYSLHKGVGVGTQISSVPFDVGGYRWCIVYCPDGDIREESKDYVGVYLKLLSEKAEVRAIFELKLVNLITGSSSSIFRKRIPNLFSTVDFSENRFGWGSSKFMKTSELEASPYLHGDSFVIECDVTVIKQPQVVESAARISVVEQPLPNLSNDLVNLLETKEGADVTFMVEREVFAAHAVVLAMRSSVFKAELYGPFREHERQVHISVEDMQPIVFRALLNFIYTGMMFHGMEDIDGEEKLELTMHLLVVADRYDVQGLKFACEKTLYERIDVETVAAMFALADRHNCRNLQDECIEFINCEDKINEVVATKGYGHLKSSCPYVLVDLYEKVAKFHKI